MSIEGVKDLLDHARACNVANLANACGAELDLQPFELSGDDASRFDQMVKAVGDIRQTAKLGFTCTILPVAERKVSV